MGGRGRVEIPPKITEVDVRPRVERSITVATDEFTEVEYSIQATSNATPGGDYCFRLYDSTGASVLDTYDVYAEASVVP